MSPHLHFVDTHPVNDPLAPGQNGPPSINREVVMEEIRRICDLLPPESLVEVLNFAIHELVRVYHAQAEEHDSSQ
jgi:hypothetical protein